MRKAFGISVAASFALLLAACADDSSCDNDCVGGADAAVKDDDNTETDEPDADEASETTSDESEAGMPTETDTEPDTDGPTEAGTSTEEPVSDASVPDVGPVDASNPNVEEDAGTPPNDAGAVTTPYDAGPTGEERDAAAEEDGGGSSGPTACELACDNAMEKECENTVCATDVCVILDLNANCLPEANAYLLCVSELDPQSAYVCNADEKPELVDTGCDDPYFNTWFTCLMNNP